LKGGNMIKTRTDWYHSQRRIVGLPFFGMGKP
jgi:hypothetical protein